jgi:isopenicillin-N epimerase
VIKSTPLPLGLYLLDPSITYLNHGSFGATPRSVFEKYQRWQRELEREPVEFLGRRFNDLMRDARAALATYIHTNADDIVYVPNATTGLNIVVRSLQLGPGDEILTSDHEYGALDRTWGFMCKKTGAVYKQQPIPVPLTTAEEFVETFWSGVTPHTRVIFLSHITSPTALIFPVQEICRRARERGIISVIDGAHSLGQIPLDLEAIGADFYSANAHKWLCAPKGSAFLYARREMQNLVEPLIVSWGYESQQPSPSRFIDEQEWTGTRDYAAYLTVPEAIKFIEEHNWDVVRAECHAIAQYAREKIHGCLEAKQALSFLCPDSREWYSQMFTVPLPLSVEVASGRSQLQRRLFDEFRIEVPVLSWQGKPYMRVSIQAYNSRADGDYLADALEKLL